TSTDARVVSGDWDHGGALGPGDPLETADTGTAVARLCGGVLLVQAGLSAGHASFTSAPQSRRARLQLHGLTTLLYLMQPLARLRGRWRYGLTPWRWRSARGLVWPWPRTLQVWSEQWQCPIGRLQTLEETLRAEGAAGMRGGDYDRWD